MSKEKKFQLKFLPFPSQNYCFLQPLEGTWQLSWFGVHSGRTPNWDSCRPPSVPIGFVPQKLGLIWWVPWECKNLGELNFHMENGLPEAQKLPNRYYHMSRSQENWSEFFFVHYWGCGRHFSGGDRSDLLKRGELLHLWFCLSLCKMSNLAPWGV